jgi:hypothetical protein
MAQQINYDARDFLTIRAELLDFIEQYYPKAAQSFSDSSIGLVLLELNAAVGNMLSFNTDRMFQETQLDSAQIKRNVFAIAKNLGLKIPGKRPAVALCDFTFTVPPSGDSFDINYLPILRRGSQVQGGGAIFENRNDIDFSSDFSANGIPNRKINPIRDANGNVISYEITKREIVTNGQTVLFRDIITKDKFKPFYNIILPEGRFTVLSIEQVISVDGTNITTIPNLDEFLDKDKQYFEVPSLAENSIFIEDNTVVSDRLGVNPGKWEKLTRKFTNEFDANGFTKLTFGSGDPDALKAFNNDGLSGLMNNMALGEIPRIGTTVFVRYRVGGGASANVGPNTINKVGRADIIVTGTNPDIIRRVQSSLKVNNPLPAIGGGEEPSIEEIRKLASYNFASQERCVTVRDYIARSQMMTGQFGPPYRVQAEERDNKVKIYTLYLDAQGKLSNTSTNTYKANLANYLSNYRMINDYVEVWDGKIINLGFDVNVFIDRRFTPSEVITGIITRLRDYMDIRNRFMGENLYIGRIIENISQTPGVINVLDIKVYNKVGDGYSFNETSQEYVNETTREIKLIDQTLFSDSQSMFEIKFPEKDIRVFVK